MSAIEFITRGLTPIFQGLKTKMDFEILSTTRMQE
jgi:hypothetical protein